MLAYVYDAPIRTLLYLRPKVIGILLITLTLCNYTPVVKLNIYKCNVHAPFPRYGCTCYYRDNRLQNMTNMRYMMDTLLAVKVCYVALHTGVTVCNVFCVNHRENGYFMKSTGL